MKIPKVLVTIALILGIFSIGHAIIIRHDRDDARYRELAKRYPAACLVGRDAGTLIAPQWVLTAAHVAATKQRGIHKIKFDGADYDIAETFIHPEWREGGAHDIALIKLAKAVMNVEPVAIYADRDEAGKPVVFAGFGGTGNGLTGPTREDGLKRAATNRVDAVDADWLRFSFDDPATATDLEGISGPGDSGGPAFIEKDGKTFVAGISVFGDPGRNGRGTYGAKEGYTRVSTHADWIRKTIDNSTTAQSNNTVKIPDTPAGKRLGELFAAIATEDGAKVREFVRAFAKSFLAQIPEDEHVSMFERVHDRQGGFDLVSVEQSTPVAIVVIARGKKTGELRRISVDVEPAAPNPISMIRIASVDSMPSSGAATSQPVRLLGAEEMNRKFDEFLSRLTAFGFSGSVLVGKDDRVLFSRSYGLADRSRNVSNTPDTLFDIGSVAKQFTAAAVLKLEMMGKLNTGDPISKFFDNVPDDKKNITIHQMLSMTSGLLFSPGPDGSDAMRDREKRVRQILDAPLMFQPGARYQYTNSGYNLAAAIVEKISGVPFEQFLYEQLFKPAGMSDTSFKNTRFRVPDWDKKTVVHLYDGDRDNGVAGQDGDSAAWFLNGPGGILTTPGDLFKWHLALTGDKILSPVMKLKLYMPVLNDYALGWRVTRGPLGKMIVHNGGTTVGAGAHFLRFVDAGLMIAFAMNNSGEDFIDPVADALGNLVIGRDVPLPPKVVPLSAASIERIAGTYTSDSGGSISVTATKERIVVAANDAAGLRALYGLNDRQAERSKAFETRTSSIIEASMKGNYAPQAEAFGGRLPIDRIAAMEKRMMDNQTARFGAYKSFTVIGSTPEPMGDVGVIARFDFDKGSFFRKYIWVPRGLDGIQPLPGPPSLTYVPTAENQFAAYDVASGEIARVRFEVDSNGRVTALVIERGPQPSRWKKM